MNFDGTLRTHVRATILVAATLMCHSAAAQDRAGVEANLTVSQGLTYSDIDGTLASTDLGFDIYSVTRNQSLSFNLDAGVDVDLENGADADTDDLATSLSYTIESRQTALTADVSYQRRDADSLVSDLDGLPDILILDEGLREDIGANISLAFGREMPFGATLQFGVDDTAYSQTTSANLVDTRTTTADIRFRFDIDDRITTTLGYSWSETDRLTGTDVRDESFQIGANLVVTPSLVADLSLGLDRVTTTNASIEAIEDGLSYGIVLTKDRPAGYLRVSLNSDLSQTGRRTTALVGGAFETRRGNFSADVGVSLNDDDDTQPLVTLSYSEELPRGSYSLSINQSFETTTTGLDSLNSRLEFNWDQDLNRSSRVSSNLTYQVTDILGLNSDTSRLRLGISYSQDLTADWALTTRYSHSIVETDSAATTRENEIFLGLETSVQWRP